MTVRLVTRDEYLERRSMTERILYLDLRKAFSDAETSSGCTRYKQHGKMTLLDSMPDCLLSHF